MVYIVSRMAKICVIKECEGTIKWGRSQKGKLIGHCCACKAWYLVSSRIENPPKPKEEGWLKRILKVLARKKERT